MPELGLFPLPLVLLPGERIPLHIFEPRYRELVGECVAEGGEFGLVLEDDRGLRDVGTRAAVVEVLRAYDDGRLDVVVEGRERFRLLRETAGRSFRTGEVEPLEDEEGGPAPEEAVGRVLVLLNRIVRTAGVEVEPLERGGPPDALSFAVAARVEFGADVKQELLELRSEPARVARLERLLKRALDALALERDVRERAAGNGHVSPRRPQES